MVTKRKTTAPLDQEEYPIREELLSDEERALVAAGTYYMSPGKDKPVLRWSDGPKKGKLAPGTGVAPKHRSLGEQSRETAWKRTAAYKDLMEARVPAENDPEKWGTFAWVMDQLLKGIEGGDVELTVRCPECSHNFKHTAWKRPDSNAGIKLIELFVGRATETKDVSLTVKQIYELMDERVDDYSLNVREMSPEEVEARKQIVEATEVRELG